MALDTNDKLTEINTTLDESSSPYYTDMYSAGETKEQLQVGFEVAKPKEASGTIDTSDVALTKLDNVYTLSVANPDGKIFSIGINGLEKTFKIGFFNNSALAYADLETQLQNWLGYDYQVAYVSGTDYTISRTDGTALSLTNPNLVRTITLTGFDTISKIDVIVDGVTVSLLGATHSGSASTAITYLKSQLSTSLYYMNDDSNVLTIARKDGAIPVITKNQYNKYTYRVNYQYRDTPNSGQFWNYTNTTIDGTTYYTYGSQGRPFYGDRIVRNLGGGTIITDAGGGGSDTTSNNVFTGTRIYLNTRSHITSVTRNTGCTATRAIIKNISGTVLATANFSGDVATFDLWLDGGAYYDVGVDSNGSSYTVKYKGNTTGYPLYTDLLIWTTTIGLNNIYSIDLEPQIDTTGYTISTVFNKSSGGSDSTWNSANTAVYFNQTHYLYINKTDYSAMTFSSLNHYTDPGTYPDDSSFYSLTTINHLADIAVTTLTEISITATLSSYGVFIPVGFNPKKIQMTATSSVGSSDNGVWTADGQSCTTKYGTTTAFIANYIFHTDTSNKGNIIASRRGGFTITWTVNTSNKLDYICT